MNDITPLPGGDPARDRFALLSAVLRLLRPLWPATLAATLLGASGGLATAALLAQVNRGLQAADGIGAGFLLAFAGLCGLSVLGKAAAGVGNSLVGQKLVAALRKDIAARILRAPIAAIERQRTHRLVASLVNDVEAVSVFTFNVSGYAVALTVTLGCFGYLLALSPALLLLVLLAVTAGMLVTHHARRAWMADYADVRDAQDDLQKQYRAITEGAKELRVDRPRRRRVFGDLLGGAVDRIASRKSHAMRLFWTADAVGSGLFFLVIGIMLLLRDRLALEPAVVSGFTIVLLYVKGPLDQLVGALPALGQAQIAFRRVARLAADFDGHEPVALVDPGGQTPDLCRSIALDGVCYAYPPADEDGRPGFAVGPIDLEIRRGEILFIVGDNGSGKTTLIKLLLGLYAAQAGAIRLDGQPVAEEARDDYRQLFATVFTDYYLFDEVGTPGTGLPPDAERYLERLDIAHKVSLRNGVFSTTDLSTGQRKRLALLNAWAAGRPVIVFDEWAADQDPGFRHLFYTELLPDLRRQGRALVVISHDDRYFGVADRVVHMAGGRIARVSAQTAENPDDVAGNAER
ncbi:cyclic peptide export ABC transporter [Azospirillum sp. B506]|uniref:cyclic peptide export ABC transporter n=1 Tax=Azospirillum sp. B506 TaxID=137721 RepID=UPI000344FAC8|nr:cyclic peptide export ABC transporter [Azospirillum sp. B506]